MGNISEAIKSEFKHKVEYYKCLGLEPISAISATQNDFKEVI